MKPFTIRRRERGGEGEREIIHYIHTYTHTHTYPNETALGLEASMAVTCLSLASYI